MEKTISALPAPVFHLPKFTISLPKSLVKSIAGTGIVLNSALALCALSIDIYETPTVLLLAVLAYLAASGWLFRFGWQRHLLPEFLYKVVADADRNGGTK